MDDQDDKELDAEERRIKGARQRVAARAGKKDDDDEDAKEPKAKEPEGEDEEIVIDEDDEDEDDEDRPSRKERRRNRYREQQDRAREADERATRAEQQAQQLQAQINQLAQQRQAPPQDGPRRHPVDAEIDAVYQRRLDLAEAYNAKQGKITREEHADFSKRARELEESHMALVARKNAAPQQAQVDPTVAHIRMTHADVLSNPSAASYAQGEFLRRKALKPAASQQEMLNMVHESYAEARKAFRMPAPVAYGAPRASGPSERQQARYAAAPRGGGGGGDGPRTVKMTPERKRMADAAYSHISDEKKRYTMWAKKVGSKLKD